MFIEEYISHKFQGEEAENESQYLTKHPKEYYDSHPDELRLELNNFYSDQVYNGNLKKSQLFAFLDFHKEKYQGEPMDFFDFIKKSTTYIVNTEKDPFTHLYFAPEYSARLGDWIMQREKDEERNKLLLGKDDTRIAINVSSGNLKKYFLEKFVETKDKNGVPYFSEPEVLHFIHANFKGFFPRVQVQKLGLSPAKSAQAYIRRTIYALYHKYSNVQNDKRRYCELLRDNFHNFDNCDFEESIVKNFSK